MSAPPPAADRGLRAFRAYSGLTFAFAWVPVMWTHFTRTRGFTPDLYASLWATYYLAMVVFELPWGWLADRVGRRPVLRAGPLLLGASFFLLGRSQDPLACHLLMALVGAGHALVSGADSAWLYDHLAATMKYDKPADKPGWGQGDALWACESRFGNCTDFHSLIIGMARACHIPARFVIGFPLPGDRTEGEIAGYHCWAELYLEGIGWLPLDSSEASKHPEDRDRFFGRLDANRVEFTRGRDLRLERLTAGLRPQAGTHEVEGDLRDLGVELVGRAADGIHQRPRA